MPSVAVACDVSASSRPRVTRNGVYFTPRTKALRSKIRTAWERSGNGVTEGPVSVTIRVFRSIPKSRPKKMQSEPDIFKPDVDNIAKNVLDALNGVAFTDDRFVVSLLIEKRPRTRCEEHIYIEVHKAGNAFTQ